MRETALRLTLGCAAFLTAPKGFSDFADRDIFGEAFRFVFFLSGEAVAAFLRFRTRAELADLAFLTAGRFAPLEPGEGERNFSVTLLKIFIGDCILVFLLCCGDPVALIHMSKSCTASLAHVFVAKR